MSKPQYEFFKKPPVGGDDLNIGPNTQHVLPTGAGYNMDNFRNDVMNVFEDAERADIKEVKNTWEDHVLYKGNQFGKRFVSVGEARQTVDAMDGFLDHLQKSPLTKALKSFNNGDSKESAQNFLDWCEYHAKGAQNMEQFIQAMSDAVEKLEEDPDIKDGPIGKGAAWNKEKHGVLNPTVLRIKELLPKVRRKYEFAALRSYTYEKSLHPEDSINVKNMESYGEIMRIPKVMLGADDDEFYCRMATKNFPVLEYERAIPNPKKFVILVDVSGSMGAAVSDTGANKGYLRSEYAQATAIALAEQAEAGGNSCEVIYFDNCAHPPISGTPRQIQDKLLAEQFSGGGTNFEAAFRAVDKTDADSVVIVTDGGSGYHKPPKVPLMTLIMGSTAREVDAYCPQLRTDSYRFEIVT